MKLQFTTLLICLSLFFNYTAKAENEDPSGKITLSGHIKDKSNGEELVGATVFVKELKTGSVTNSYGFYSVTVESGNYTIIYSYMGFNTIEKKIQINKSLSLDIELSTNESELDEVTVKGEKANVNVTKAEMSVTKMEMKTIKKIPAFMGEVDVIKAIQLLPGVQTTSEGGSGFSVRGGGRDQNLILLDEAPVYNASHLMGFFSVFNNDAIKEVKLYKGDIPASSGGRLSSLLDVRMKNGNSKNFSATGGIGSISSRLTLEGPILKDKTSYIVSGRRTYVDVFFPLTNKEELKSSSLYFYDLNMKVNHQINENNRVFLSGYFGKDIFSNKFFGFGFGNQTLSLRWNHLFTPSLFANTTLIYSKYDYFLKNSTGDANSFKWISQLIDYSAKVDFNYFVNPSNTVTFGVSTTKHKFEPGMIKSTSSKSMFNDYFLPDNHALEHGAYVSNEQKVGYNLTLKYGIRYSVFQNIGTATIYKFDQNFDSQDSVVYGNNKVFNTYSGLEPRLGFTYLLNAASSIKASYSRTLQFMQLASNSTGGSPMDIWFPSSPNVKPQVANQFAVGYFRNFKENTYETSVELYYKKIDNVIDFKDHAILLLNPKLEGELRYGDATAYGAEFMVKINKEKLNGWVSYTYSRTERKINGINNGEAYPAPYDKPHDIAVVLNYELSKRVSLSANWIYATGSPYTAPVGRFEYEGKILPVYSKRNGLRMPDYHRLDLSVNIAGKEKPNKRWKGEWNISVYNAYARKNAWVINFVQDKDDPYKTYAEKTYLFSILPAVTYNFTF